MWTPQVGKTTWWEEDIQTGEGRSRGIESKSVPVGEEMDPQASFCLLFAAECPPGAV